MGGGLSGSWGSTRLKPERLPEQRPQRGGPGVRTGLIDEELPSLCHAEELNSGLAGKPGC